LFLFKEDSPQRRKEREEKKKECGFTLVLIPKKKMKSKRKGFD
jgi:hypothetical protein